MVSQSRIKANAKYDAAHCTGVYLKLNNKTDSDILVYLSSVSNRQGYIKQLIREDIARTGSVPGKSTVSVPFSAVTMDILTEIANEKGISVPDLIAVTMSEQLLRYHMPQSNDSAPKSHKDPYADILANAVDTWTDYADGLLSDSND